MPSSPTNAIAPSRAILARYAAVLVLAGTLAYLNSFRGQFLLDDVPAILENPTIRDLTDLGDVLLPGTGYGITTSGRPILNLSLALNHALSCTEVWSYHALNLLIHLLAGLTLFGVVRRTLVQLNPTLAPDAGTPPTPRSGRLRELLQCDATPLAFVVALLWLLHPLQTESVTYIIQRTESLMGFFVLLTLYGFIRAATSARPWPWRIVTVAACLAGVGSKEVAAVAPLLVFLYDRTFLAGSFRAAWSRRRWLHLSLAATWVLLALLVASTGWNRGGTAGFDVGVSPFAYWATQAEAIARYLKLSFWPHPLVFEYGTFWSGFAEAAPYALLVLPLLIVTIVALWRWPAVGFLGAWFFLILAPTSLVPGTIQMIVEHRMYLPLAAVVTAVIVGLHVWLNRRADGTAPAQPWWSLRRPLLPGLALAVPLSVLTVQRNALYADDLALWQQTVAVRPASALAQSSLGTALYLRNRQTESMQHYQTAFALNPNLVSVRYNLGLAYAALGQLVDAVTHYQAALRINPHYGPAHYQQGLALLAMNQPQPAAAEFAEAARLLPTMAEAHYEWGVALVKSGRLNEAVDKYQAALRLKPGFVDAHCDLGSALLMLNRAPEAVTCFERALQFTPTLAPAHLNLGLALARTGDTAKATSHFAEAVRLEPTNPAAQSNLGLALAGAGAMDQAMAHFAEAARLAPQQPTAHLHLGNALAQLGRLPDAIGELEQTVRLDPTSAEAHCNLGVVLSRTGRIEDSLPHYETALRLRPDYLAAHFNLGVALFQLRRFPEARQHFEATLRLNPAHTPAREMIRRIEARG